ncbi:MAG: cupin domain-containing protein [Ramlibacter sp.]|nr:cupin domain-containing protein [Ramlibacter sp.]
MTLPLINADRETPALVHAGRLPWVDSPQPGVQRRLLERRGDEVALATSIVRYAAGSRFTRHVHELGEEFLVLQGVFSDEHGHYPSGTYVRNPPGSSHAPFSETGCIIFVKLRQMRATERQRVVVLPHEQRWTDPAPGQATPATATAPLHAGADETVHLERLAAGCTIPAQPVEGGQELLVVEGSITLGTAPQPLECWGWLRQPGRSQPAIASPGGALLWVKRGHLAGA